MREERKHVALLATPLCDRIGIDVPIVQAPVGSAASPDLVAAVANAGGLGMLAATWLHDEQARRQIETVQRSTPRPFGVNLVLDFPVESKLALCHELGVAVVSTFWGDPAAVNEQIRHSGALHLHTVGSVDEARRAVDAGVDAIVAQGWEAGGHVRGGIATMALVPAIVDAVSPVPVIAAGGIADGRGLVAALALGAQAAWLGTRFLASVEASTHHVYRRHIVRAAADDAVYTLCFDGGWPSAPHRALRNATIERWLAAGSPAAPDRPGEADVVATDAQGRPHMRYEDLMPLPGMEGTIEEMAMYAGQSVELVRTILPAADIVRAIVEEAVGIVTRLRAKDAQPGPSPSDAG
jgi:NAD(P)H-dependent flavin oxidoreductase YrpB (nitropropane dioxygenase family)